MEATPFQIVGCVFSSQPASERIDDFAHRARRERAVITAKNARQATFVKFGATDAALVALACRVAQGAGLPLRVGFACSASDRAAPDKDGARVSSRAIAQASELAASARDGEVLLSAQLAALVLDLTLEFRARDVHLPGGRTAVACTLDADATARDDSATDSPAAEPAGVATAGGVDQALQALAARVDTMQRRQAELAAGEDALLQQLARATAQLQQLTQRIGELAQATAQIDSRRAAIDEVQARADGVAHLLGDLQVNLEMIGEQRAVIEEVGEKLARLDFTVQEASSALRGLQRERELAERIGQELKSLRARPGKAIAGR